MHPGAADKGCGGVTGTAIQAGGEVSRVGLEGFTFCCVAVMTGGTVVDDAGMIKHRAEEAERGTGRVADTAVLIGCYMGA